MTRLKLKQALLAALGAAALIAAATAAPGEVYAAVVGAELDGRTLGVAWLIPFIGILLSIAVFPLAAPAFWHHHFGKISAFWAAAIIVPLLAFHGVELTVHALLHTMLLEYIPFIILLFSLFTVAGGILIKGNLHGSPVVNTGMLAFGTGIASFIGTTGASMLMIRPMLRANDDRQHNIHVFVFFIFLVSNIGGSLTPLGDPPLFLGFLKGVDFFWTMTHMLLPMLLVVALLLAAFFAFDSYLYAREGHLPRDPTPDQPLGIVGKVNFLLLGGVILAVLMSGIIDSLGTFAVYGTEMDVKNVVRDVALVVIALASLVATPNGIREANAFTWFPILEVAKLFAGIFVTIIPAIAILHAGSEGAMAGLLELLTTAAGTPSDPMYFWLTGGLSSFLDNAPTYLVFFNAASGDAQELMGPLASTLLAISAGAVFMGAMTYIGNAPNFMVKSIAQENGVKMPSFFGYMVWSIGFLLPCFLLVTYVFF